MKNALLKIIFIVFIFFAGVMNTSASAPATKKAIEYKVPILVYHSFGPMVNSKESKMTTHYRVTEKNFEEQMKYLSDNNYHPISFSAYVDSINNKTKLPDKAIVLTFDDGWKTQYTYAVPILEKYKFTATFFIVTSYVNGNYKAYMTWDNLKDLVKNGFDIESHTNTHQMLTKVNTKKLNDELFNSKKILEDKLGIKVKTIAYPNYMQNATVRNAVKSAGYIGARAGWGNFKNSLDHIYEITSQEVVSNPNPFSSKRLPDLP
ncbi:MAG: polysaccharide deacetylase family protein [bacterium]